MHTNTYIYICLCIYVWNPLFSDLLFVAVVPFAAPDTTFQKFQRFQQFKDLPLLIRSVLEFAEFYKLSSSLGTSCEIDFFKIYGFAENICNFVVSGICGNFGKCWIFCCLGRS